MDESLLLSAIIKDRKSYDVAMKIGLEASDFSDAGKLLVECASEQYQRDSGAQYVSNEMMEVAIKRRISSADIVKSYVEYVQNLPPDISRVNVTEEYRLLRRARVALTLASRLAQGMHDRETEELIAKYAELNEAQGGNEERYRLDAEDFEDAKSERIPLSPEGLKRFVGGGVLRGHNITVYGRPDSGKSMFALNFAAFALAHGYKVLYVANEEPDKDITRKLLARLCDKPITGLQTQEAVREALTRCADSYARWYLLHKAGATIRDIKTVAGAIRPDIIIVDQLKNIRASEDNRALQLDRLAREVRELGIEYNAVTISVTQAGDSASGKAILSMNDIEWSNTGIPGAADLMIGVGVTDQLDLEKRRILSIPKNKINGKHGQVPVFVDPMRTKFSSTKMREKYPEWEL